VALIHQTVRETGRPSSGGIRQLQVAFLRSLDGEFSDYWAFRAEAQQFVHLANEHQVLALRGFATWIDPTGAGVVPFQRLMTNDAPDLLRGHQDFRFRDRGMAVLSAEYRWPLWVWSRAHGTGLDMYLLSDVGQVFRRRKDLAISSLSTSVGAGLRLVGDRDFVGLLEVGRSDEEWVVRLRGEQIFQFARGGLYYGQSRVPNR
jgi:outer membrane protein assembly factor BamA